MPISVFLRLSLAARWMCADSRAYVYAHELERLDGNSAHARYH